MRDEAAKADVGTWDVMLIVRQLPVVKQVAFLCRVPARVLGHVMGPLVEAFAHRDDVSEASPDVRVATIRAAMRSGCPSCLYDALELNGVLKRLAYSVHWAESADNPWHQKRICHRAVNMLLWDHHTCGFEQETWSQ